MRGRSFVFEQRADDLDRALAGGEDHAARQIGWDSRIRVQGLPVHTLVRGRFVMRDRQLMPETRGWDRSVHTIQRMPPPQVRNTEQTTAAITRKP